MADAASISEQLDRQIETMRAVLESLAAERSALLCRDANALEQALAKKNQRLTQVAELERERRSMTALDTTDPEQTARWTALMELTRECQAANLSNGALIRGQRRLVQNTLQWLRGADDGAGVYGPDGTEPGGVNQRASIASA